MDKAYWDALADNFSSDVLEITERDINNTIKKMLRRLGGPAKTAIDFGCGTGALTRLAAPYFKSVLGVDFSAQLLKNAVKSTIAPHVSYEKVNLQKPGKRRLKCDVALCANVLIHQDRSVRSKIAKTVISSIKRGGAGAFIVPSLESEIRTQQVILKCRLEEGGSETIEAAAIDREFNRQLTSLARGVARVGGEPTKLFMEDELSEFLESAGFRKIKITRVNYPWEEVLEAAPEDPKSSPPWDWLATCVV